MDYVEECYIRGIDVETDKRASFLLRDSPGNKYNYMTLDLMFKLIDSGYGIRSKAVTPRYIYEEYLETKYGIECIRSTYIIVLLEAFAYREIESEGYSDIVNYMVDRTQLYKNFLTGFMRCPDISLYLRLLKDPEEFVNFVTEYHGEYPLDFMGNVMLR